MELEKALISGKISGYIDSKVIVKYNKRAEVAHIIYKNGDVVTIFSGCIKEIKSYIDEV